MNFNYSEEQNLLKDSIAKFISNDYSYETRQKHVAMEKGFNEATWNTFAELGWLCVPFSEDDGGIGGGPVEIMIVMEEFGKGLVVEPFVPSVILSGAAIAAAGSEQQKADLLPAIIDGSQIFSLAFVEPQARFDLYDVKTTASETNGKFTLNGAKSMVIHGGSADTFLVVARTSGEQRDEQGISVFLVPADAKGVVVKSYRTLDGQRAAEVVLDNVEVQASALLGVKDQAYELLQTISDDACLALGAEAVGIMEKLYKETVEYTKERKQFGVPIAIFQALQHRMVDMFTLQQECRSLLLRAVLSHESGAKEYQKNVSALKYAVAVKGQKVAHEAVQIFGGMGMTDEMNVGMYLKRINMINTLFGNGDYHLRRFMAL
ncbi:pimeloyl-CoA dehydrogenase small subunit [Ketobacter sp. MCCC 1A13808]|uniref:acyl-CoA dehydrogenase family protein n=1 Tax=Ketobacter sp. MCCC 1A13808 TaxID=2602738 RepID=UPI0012EBEC59|nr:acyl-CoA dehydrogenase [Ketobacter sp. MCCC 1A13808]MVF12801.1 pimeloyl-CoA dehydrogenase small subunit [Ketobacter sp. MCCC 1A13808]